MVFMLLWQCINKPTDLKIDNIKFKLFKFVEEFWK